MIMCISSNNAFSLDDPRFVGIGLCLPSSDEAAKTEINDSSLRDVSKDGQLVFKVMKRRNKKRKSVIRPMVVCPVAVSSCDEPTILVKRSPARPEGFNTDLQDRGTVDKRSILPHEKMMGSGSGSYDRR